MPKFKYTVKDAQGQTTTAHTEAHDEKSLIEELQKQGLFILKIENAQVEAAKTQFQSKKKTKAQNKLAFTHKSIKLADLVSFSRQLTAMLEAGVTLMRSLEVITGQCESEGLYAVLFQITRDVEQGKSLSEAMAQHPKVFNQFWVSLVEVGEASGTMPIVLNKLAFYLEQQAAFRSTIVSAIMYPAILFVVCIGAVAFFALVVGPKFQKVFNSMGVELPLITKVLLSTFAFIKSKILFITVGAVAFFFGFRAWIKTPPGRLSMERFFYGMPVLGRIYKLIIVERFTSQMAILVESGVPILTALEISARLVDNMICSAIIQNISESVRQGELLVAPMTRSNFFPGMALQMITVGEETGELSKMLNHVAHFYQETVETFMKRLGTIIEPFMLVFMGGVIGVIVLAMFLPMFNLSQLGGAGGG